MMDDEEKKNEVLRYKNSLAAIDLYVEMMDRSATSEALNGVKTMNVKKTLPN